MMHNLRQSLSIFALAIGATAALPAQTIVTGGGTNLQTAVQAAAPGDVLIVRAGSYNAVSIQRGITVLCDSGVQLFGIPTTASPATLEFTNIPADETAVWSGGRLTVSIIERGTLRITQCPGQVHLDGLTARTVRIQAADRVTMTALDMPIGDTFSTRDVIIEDSNVSMLRCTIQSGRASLFGAVVVTATRSNLVLQDTRVVATPDPIFNLKNDAVLLDQGTLSVQGAGSHLESFGPSSASIRVVAGTVDLDPSATLVGSVVGTTTSRVLPFVDVTSVATGTVSTARTVGVPGTLAATLIGLPGPRITRPYGELWTTFPPITLGIGLVPASGEVLVPYTLPAAALGVALVFQGVGIDLSNGNVDLGAPTVAFGR